jgi:hypothetical protein
LVDNSFQVFIVKTWEGRRPIPSKEVRTKEFHQLKVRVDAEDGAVPVAGVYLFVIAAERSIQIPGEIKLAGN